MEDRRKRMSRGARLNVGMLDDNKEWIQKFSRSQYNYRATALLGTCRSHVRAWYTECHEKCTYEYIPS